MRPHHETLRPSRERHRKQRHARKHADRMDTATLGAVVAALGAGSVEDWVDADPEQQMAPWRASDAQDEGTDE